MRRIVLAPELFRLQRAIVAQAMEVSLSNIESLIIAVETDPDLAEFAVERGYSEGSSRRVPTDAQSNNCCRAKRVKNRCRCHQAGSPS